MSLALVAWIIGTTIWFNKHYANYQHISAPPPSTFITQKASFQTIEPIPSAAPSFSKLNIYYAKNDYTFKSTPLVGAYFGKLREFLKAHPEQSLHINGYATLDEKEATHLSNARIESLESFLIQEGFEENQFIKQAKEINPSKSSAEDSKSRRIELRFEIE